MLLDIIVCPLWPGEPSRWRDGSNSVAWRGRSV